MRAIIRGDPSRGYFFGDLFVISFKMLQGHAIAPVPIEWIRSDRSRKERAFPIPRSWICWSADRGIFSQSSLTFRPLASFFLRLLIFSREKPRRIAVEKLTEMECSAGKYYAAVDSKSSPGPRASCVNRESDLHMYMVIYLHKGIRFYSCNDTY